MVNGGYWLKSLLFLMMILLRVVSSPHPILLPAMSKTLLMALLEDSFDDFKGLMTHHGSEARFCRSKGDEIDVRTHDNLNAPQ